MASPLTQTIDEQLGYATGVWAWDVCPDLSSIELRKAADKSWQHAIRSMILDHDMFCDSYVNGYNDRKEGRL